MAEEKDKEISLRELVLTLDSWLSYLKSKWLVLFIAGILGLGLGLAYVFLKKPQYVAVTTFVLEEGSGGGAIGQYAGLASMIGIDLGGGGNTGIFQGDNIIELYKSRSMIQQTLLSEYSFNDKPQLLIERYAETNGLWDQWKQDPYLSTLSFRGKAEGKALIVRDSILGEVVKRIRRQNLNVVKPDKKLSIIDVQVTSPDQWFAKAFNDLLVRNVNQFYVETKTKKSLQNLAVLQHQTDSVRRELNSAISGVARAVEVNPNPNMSRQSLRVPSQRRQVDAQANTAILTELVKNLELSKVSLRKETPLIQVIDAPIMPLNKVESNKVLLVILLSVLFVFLTSLFLLTRRGLNNITG